MWKQRYEAIAAAAMELFQARGFDAVTVADVARSADVSEKTVFNYFPAKEDLVFHRGAWTHRIVFRSAFGRLLAGEDRRVVAGRLRTEAERAYDLVARGLGDY